MCHVLILVYFDSQFEFKTRLALFSFWLKNLVVLVVFVPVTNNHLHDKIMQWMIISDELKDDYLLQYEEAFNKENVTFENLR